MTHINIRILFNFSKNGHTSKCVNNTFGGGKRNVFENKLRYTFFVVFFYVTDSFWTETKTLSIKWVTHSSVPMAKESLFFLFKWNDIEAKIKRQINRYGKKVCGWGREELSVAWQDERDWFWLKYGETIIKSMRNGDFSLWTKIIKKKFLKEWASETKHKKRNFQCSTECGGVSECESCRGTELEWAYTNHGYHIQRTILIIPWSVKY